jgi:acyl-coenzyme A synthetase/AMP-(fatty) acid ligase
MIVHRLDRLMTDARAAEDVVAWRGGEALRFGGFRRLAQGVAARFAGRSAAALVCEDSYAFIAGFFGLLHAGVRVVLPSSAEKAVLDTIRDHFETVVDERAIAAAQAGGDTPLPELEAERGAIDFFTSGSTGAPKRIVKSLAMFERETAMLEQAFGAGLAGARHFATVPHQHMFGLPFKLMWPLAAGRPFVAETHGLWETLLADLSGGAVIVSSPAHLNRLTGLEPIAADRRPRRIFSAGAPLPLSSSRDAEAILGCRPTEIFGSSETGAFATRQQTADDEPWRLLPGIAIRHDDEGRMSVLTPVVGPDWIGMSDLIAPTDGGFCYRGRADRIVKVEGKRICLITVEDALVKLALVEAAAVIVLKDPLRIAAAVVTSKEGSAVLAELGAFRFGRQLRKTLKSAIDPAGLPRQWRFVPALPSHVMGKRRDGDIARLFEEPR